MAFPLRGPHSLACAAGLDRRGLDVPGKMTWRARYLKQVDAEEQTIRFWQEIYDADGLLVEIHEKYPNDLGHKHVTEPRQ